VCERCLVLYPDPYLLARPALPRDGTRYKQQLLTSCLAGTWRCCDRYIPDENCYNWKMLCRDWHVFATPARFIRVTTVQFPYLETCGAMKWGKDEKGVASCEAGTCFMARHISPKYCPRHSRRGKTVRGKARRTQLQPFPLRFKNVVLITNRTL
jgi:hypothetical protein